MKMTYRKESIQQWSRNLTRAMETGKNYPDMASELFKGHIVAKIKEKFPELELECSE